MGRFSLSVNPAGLAFFGPLIHAEMGLGKHLRISTHLRIPGIGMINRMVYSPSQRIRGYGIGGGFMGFIGKQKNKPYVGFSTEYSRTTAYYTYPYESVDTDKFYILAFHAGYRMRYKGGYFAQYGIYLFATSETDEVKFSVPHFRTGNSDIPIPLPYPDLRFGIEF
jgi:hypothetical protein